jgi:MFS family permease
MTQWRTPVVVVVCGGLILTLCLGIRQSFGLYLAPMTQAYGWGRETFSFAIAIQNLTWGLAQPITGMIADRYGAGRVAVTGGVLYALGLLLMPMASTGLQLGLSAGLLIGLGLSGTGFAIVYGAIGRRVAPEKASAALGMAGALGSLGQFVMLPYSYTLIARFGWMQALVLLAVTSALMVPLASALVRTGAVTRVTARSMSMVQAVREAAGDRGFWLLNAGFLACGFQLAFMTSHLPAFLLDTGLGPAAGMTALAIIGAANIPGTWLCGYLGGRFRQKYVLSGLYALRASATVLYVVMPITALSTYAFAVVMGLTWLGTVPLTGGLVSRIFGAQYASTLFGFVFLGHQVGGFAGVWMGGYVFDVTGSYAAMWLLSIALGVLAALLHLPIDDRARAPLAAPRVAVSAP